MAKDDKAPAQAPPAHQTDFRADDTMAPPPVMPEVPAIAEDQIQDDIETTQMAEPYWHPAWAPVEKRFKEALEAYGGNNAMAYKDLPADEFKIKMMSERVVYDLVKELMEDVKSAVEAVEQQPSRPRQPRRSAGG